jgi:ubiquitin-protein ligase
MYTKLIIKKTKRLNHEFDVFKRNPMPGTYELITENKLDTNGDTLVNVIDAYVFPRVGSIYHGYKFHVQIDLGELFPFKPISVKFITKIKHLNVLNGTICPKTLGTLDPNSLTLRDILLSVASILDYPDEKTAFDNELYSMYVNNIASYEKFVTDYLTLNATVC